MARDRANIRVDMLGNTEYRQLTVHAQHLYMHLMIHPTLSYAGVADWRPGRLAKMAAGQTARDVLNAADELMAGHFIYWDEDTEEVFVRSFVRHDGLLSRARMAVAMAKAYAEISSPEIRRYFAWELKRLRDESPDLECWSDGRVNGILREPMEDMKTIGHAVTQPLPDPSVDHQRDPSVMHQGKPSVDPSVAAHLDPSVDLPPTTATATATTTPTDVGGSGGKRSPEVPLPQDWSPSESHAQYAKKKNLDLQSEAERFKLHAEANDRRQRNWNATFSMWLSKSKSLPQEEFNPWNQ